MADWLWVSCLCGGSAKGDYSSTYEALWFETLNGVTIVSIYDNL